jgi:hypothetical protein
MGVDCNFAPETVVFTVFQEWLKARVFLKELNEISDQRNSPEVKLPRGNYGSGMH